MQQRQQQKENPGHNCLGISLKVAKQVEDKTKWENCHFPLEWISDIAKILH